MKGQPLRYARVWLHFSLMQRVVNIRSQTKTESLEPMVKQTIKSHPQIITLTDPSCFKEKGYYE